jgi:mRNA interferase RelE/StbE
VYKLEVSHAAHRQIIKLPIHTQERINEAIADLGDTPRPFGSIKLTAKEGHRIRVGDYRILYNINDDAKLVIIYRVRARGDAYRA